MDGPNQYHHSEPVPVLQEVILENIEPIDRMNIQNAPFALVLSGVVSSDRFLKLIES